MPIDFWHGLQKGPVLDSFKQIVAEWNFEQSHARAFYETEYQSTDYQIVLKDFTDYGAPVNEGLTAPIEQQPSLVLAPEYTSGKLMNALKEHKIIPITELLDQNLLNNIADIVKRTFGDKNGNLVSLPFNPACGVIFTNKTLLKKMGNDPDFVPRSIEELEELAQQMVRLELVEAGYTCAWPAAYLVEVPASQQNIPLILPENGKLGYGKYIFAQDWLKQHFVHLRQQQKAKTFLYAGQDNNSRHPFIKGKVAFFMQGSTHLPLLQSEANASEHPFEVGCGPLPTLVKGQNEKYAFPLGGAAIWVFDNPQTRTMIEGVRAFLNFLASEKIQTRWHQETAYVPVLKTIPDTMKDFHLSHPLHKAVVAQTIEALPGEYCLGLHAPNYPEARKALFVLIENILDEKTSDDEIDFMLAEFDAKFSMP